jgi:Xaa-Pro aminopeptidase
MNPLFSPETYHQRREALKQKIHSGIALFLGNTEASINYPSNTYAYRQDSSFVYFFGIAAPDLAACIDFDSGEEILFGTDFTVDDIIWMGNQPTIRELAQKTGVSKTEDLTKLGDYLQKIKNRTIHYLPPYRGESKIFLTELFDIPVSHVEEKASLELIKAVVSLRSIKSEEEIAEMEKASTIGAMMHHAAMRLCQIGQTEQFLYGLVEGIALQYGRGTSFPVILSQRGETLHNHNHNSTLEDGKMLLIDAGCETDTYYCSDHTRTFPVNGKFTQKQKEIYEIVLKANTECIALSKPDLINLSVHAHAVKIIAEGLKELGLLKGNTEDAVANGAHFLFMPHGLGHQIGMDVHDMESFGENHVGYNEETPRSTQLGFSGLRMGRRLLPGICLTVEPGIYFIPQLIEKWKSENKLSEFINYEKAQSYIGFGGIRIEDSIVITPEGARILGMPLPKTITELESLIGTH